MSGEAPMTGRERADLAALVRKRGRLARAEVDEHAAAMLAAVEAQLAAVESAEDAAWGELTELAKVAVEDLNRRVADVAAARGIPEELTPSASLGWCGRGRGASKERRAELRRMARQRIDAAAVAAKRRIDTQVVEAETQLVREGQTSERAAAFLAALPTAADLMAAVNLPELPGVPEWTPAPGAVAALLSTGGPRTNNDRHAAILAALAAHPEASDRELGRLAGADHKTVARARVAIPAPGGDIPQPDEVTR